MATQLKPVKGDPPDGGRATHEPSPDGLGHPVSVPVAVYGKIAAVQGALARHGIGKDRTNSTPGANYKFRGIDDVYNALAPLLAEHGLCILPRMIGHSLTERGQTQRGNPIFSAVVDAEFDFVAAEDGSVHTIRTFGEAMDSSDKATNKAMSAAYKYAAFMAFAIPTEGDNDADASTPELAARGQSQGGAVSPSQSRPFIEDKPAKPTNWGGRYPTKTALKQAMHTHHAELERIGIQATMDDLEGYLSSPEYQDYIRQATEHAPAYLEGPLPDSAPPEFIQTFTLEQKARDMIALRGNVPADVEG